MFERGTMDMLLMPEYIVDTPPGLIDADTWVSETRSSLGKRKHWLLQQEEEEGVGVMSATVEEDADAGCGSRAKMSRSGGGEHNSWEQVEELAADLDGSCSLSSLNVDLATSGFQASDALLSLPSLSGFKQELLSPFNETPNGGETNGGGGGGVGNPGGHTSPHGSNHLYGCYEKGTSGDYGCKIGLDSPSHSESGASNCGSIPGTGGVTTAPATSTVSPHHTEDCRFQYVLAAATSIATKVNEETLTYLNQGQSYEIKLKKLGDLSEYRGKILKSVVRLVFHERRLQYMEREQLAAWEASHPGDSILEVDLPLSYGLLELSQDPTRLNTIDFLWDPTKEVGVYIKVNCISTEFTPKKHGGEKGVPFRIQVETYLHSEHGTVRHLHTASCQVKVFKLKGADRKHKQDREKIHKRPPLEQEKYQCSYECTILTDVPINGDNSFPPLLLNGSHSPPGSGSDVAKLRQVVPIVTKEESSPLSQPSLNSPTDQTLQKLCGGVVDGNGAGGNATTVGAGWSPQEVARWLQANRLGSHVPTFGGYCGADLLRLSRESLVQLCGLPDGIRMYNTLHARAIAPRLTLYVCFDPTQKVYQAIYLETGGRVELCSKLAALVGAPLANLYFEGPNSIRVIVSDELVSHVPDQSTFTVDILSRDANTGRYQLLLKQMHLQPNSP